MAACDWGASGRATFPRWAWTGFDASKYITLAMWFLFDRSVVAVYSLRLSAADFIVLCFVGGGNVRIRFLMPPIELRSCGKQGYVAAKGV